MCFGWLWGTFLRLSWFFKFFWLVSWYCSFICMTNHGSPARDLTKVVLQSSFHWWERWKQISNGWQFAVNKSFIKLYLYYRSWRGSGWKMVSSVLWREVCWCEREWNPILGLPPLERSLTGTEKLCRMGNFQRQKSNLKLWFFQSVQCQPDEG